MDGNGRWAKERGLPRTAGHERGEHALFDVVEGAIEMGVKAISAYAFSTENWSRSPEEVRFLMGFNRDVIRRRRDEMHELGVRVRWAGRAPRLWRSVIKELQIAEELTKDNDVFTLTMCVNYGVVLRSPMPRVRWPMTLPPARFAPGESPRSCSPGICTSRSGLMPTWCGAPPGSSACRTS